MRETVREELQRETKEQQEEEGEEKEEEGDAREAIEADVRWCFRNREL